MAGIKRHIQDVIDYDNRVIGREFFDAVLADMILDRHYVWRHRGIRPTTFAFIANKPGDGRAWKDSLAAHFGPIWGWQRISYRRALRKTELTLEIDFTRLCRERWQTVWRPQVFHAGTCDHAGCALPAEDVDHVVPAHAEIVRACWPKVSVAERVSWWAAICHKTQPGHFVLPEGCEAVLHYDAMTAGGMFSSLCKEHHWTVTFRRAGQTK